jgi:hypothetical protein
VFFAVAIGNRDGRRKRICPGEDIRRYKTVVVKVFFLPMCAIMELASAVRAAVGYRMSTVFSIRKGLSQLAKYGTCPIQND